MKNLPMPISDPHSIIEETIKAVTEYAKACEHEKTERYRISAYLKSVTKLIETNSRDFENYMNTRFTERAEQYKFFQEMIKASIENCNDDLAKFLIEHMVRVYEKNPMEGFERIRNASLYISKGSEGY